MRQPERVILTNMCMIYDDNGNILVQDRLDKDWPGITFPGGHVENGESLTDAVVREIREETGLQISHVQMCGIKCGMEYMFRLFTEDDITEHCCWEEDGKAYNIVK